MAALTTPPIPEGLWLRLWEITGNLGNSSVEYWRPSEDKGQFDVQEVSPWLQMAPGVFPREVYECPRGTLPPNTQLFDTTSVFQLGNSHGFSHIRFNCVDPSSSAEAQDPVRGWLPLTFQPQRKRDDASNAHFFVGYYIPLQQIPAYNSESWDELLGPRYSLWGPRPPLMESNFDLSGSISTIWALIAFATNWQHKEEMIEASFLPRSEQGINREYIPSWVQRWPKDERVSHQRGLIVEVAFDDQKVTKQELRNWESGLNGPLLMGSSRHDRHH